MNGSNPMLSEKVFGDRGLSGDSMTSRGAVTKTLALVFVALVATSLPVSLYLDTNSTSSVMPYLWVGAIGGLVLVLGTYFVPRISPWTAPIYAALQGLFMGAISVMFEVSYPGIVFQAVGLTFAVTFSMLFLYRTRIIKVTARLRMMIVGATFGALLFYLVVLGASFFGADVGALFDGSPLAIGISLLITGIAAFNLLLDFDFIEQGAAHGAPKYMEWFAALGLMVTLVWLYTRLLQLLGQFRR